MWVVISLIFCQIATSNCIEITPQDPVIGMAACAIQGQVLGEQYQEEHPKWVLKGIRCTIGKKDKGEDA